MNGNKVELKKLVCWLMRCKARVRIPGQASKRNMKKNIFSAISSQQISGKNSAMNNFITNISFGIDFKL